MRRSFRARLNVRLNERGRGRWQRECKRGMSRKFGRRDLMWLMVRSGERRCRVSQRRVIGKAHRRCSAGTHRPRNPRRGRRTHTRQDSQRTHTGLHRVPDRVHMVQTGQGRRATAQHRLLALVFRCETTMRLFIAGWGIVNAPRDGGGAGVGGVLIMERGRWKLVVDRWGSRERGSTHGRWRST